MLVSVPVEADRRGRRAGRVILMRHVARLLGSTIAYGVSTRRITLLLLVLLGVLLVAVVSAAEVVAPIAVYPFV